VDAQSIDPAADHSAVLANEVRMSHMKRLLSALTLFAAVSLHAAAWKLEVQGGRALGSAYASGMPGDASTVWFNPAGMLLLDRTTVTAGAPVIDLSIEYRDSVSTSLLGQPMTGASTQEGGALVVVPHLYYVRPLGERLRFGFGFNTPFGLGTDYGEKWVGRYQAVETRFVLYNLNPSLAWKINDQLSFGGGINLQYIDAVFSTMIDFGSIGFASGLPLQPQQHDGKVEVTGDNWAVGYNAGVVWQPLAPTRLGVAYRSETRADIEGTARFEVPPEAQLLTAGGSMFQPTGARTSLLMPESWSFNVRHELTSRLTLLGDATWTGWSPHERLTVTFDNPMQPPIEQAADWKDTWRMSAGAEYMLTNRLTARAGYAAEQSPVPGTTREPRVPEADHTWYTVGATWSLSPRMDLDFFLVHLTTDRAAITVSSPLAGSLAGRAEWNIWTAGISVSRRF
jgi:long-chain fatty acid transport protein